MTTTWFGRSAYLVGVWAVLSAPPAAAQPGTTYTRDVAPILFEHCVSCHRPGEIAPMSLLSYEEARPWARAIKEFVASRKMPPWFADPRHGSFKNESRLTEQEIDTIVRWVDAGAPRGDLSELPAPPTFVDGWQLGEPDHIVALNPVTVPADGPDYYPDLNVRLDLSEPRWIRAIEIRPSNRRVTHHSVIFTDGNRGQLEGQGRESGFFDVLAVWSVGTNPHEFPEGMGRWVYPGQAWTVNAHYHPSGQVETDQTEVGLYFGEGDMTKEVMAALAGTTTFEIPPHSDNHEIRSSYIIDQDVSVISYFPHMHLRGRDMKLVANYPNGETETLISIPDYDFDWQLFYYPDRRVSLPRGTRVDVIAHYDNSSANPFNPDPDAPVRFGLQTTDEMMFNVFEFIADEGVSPEPTSAETKREALLATIPKESAYRVDLEMGRRRLPSALDLPEDGEGTWYIPMGSNLLVFPVQNISWSDNTYQFDMHLRLGRMEGDFVIEGAVDPGGAITGRFTGDRDSPFADFEGERARSVE